MVVSRIELETQARNRKLVENAFLHDLETHWRKVAGKSVEEIRDAVLEFLPALIDQYGSAVASLAAQWFENLIGSEAEIPDLYSPDTWQASARWALSPLWDGETDKGRAFAHLVAVGLRHVRNHERYTMIANVERTPGVLYARVPTGLHNCSFCLILASRGPVYGSEEDAKFRKRDGHRFHDGCDCQIVPMRGQWIPDSDSDRGERWEGDRVAGYDFDQLYQERYKPFWEPGDNVRDTIRRRDKIIKARAKELRDATNPRDWDERKVDTWEYGYRQASLLSDPGDGRLSVGEIETAEALEARGYRIRWKTPDLRYNEDGEINGNLPTPDLEWPIGSGIFWEAKAIFSEKLRRASYRRISESVKKAIKQGRKKEFFILYMRDKVLPDSVRKSLEEYNQNHPHSSIRRLLVIHSDGKVLEEISLK